MAFLGNQHVHFKRETVISKISSAVSLPNNVIQQSSNIINERIVQDYNMLGLFYKEMKLNLSKLNIDFQLLEMKQLIILQ